MMGEADPDLSQSTDSLYVRNLLFVRVGGGRYRDTGTEDVNSGEGRQGVVQGCRWVLTEGHTVQVLEVTEVTVKSCFLHSGSSRGLPGPSTAAAVRTTQQFPSSSEHTAGLVHILSIVAAAGEISLVEVNQASIS